MTDELFRIVDEHGRVYSGYNNTYGLYRNKAKAALFAAQELALLARRQKSLHARGLAVDPLPTLRVQRTTIVWEDLE